MRQLDIILSALFISTLAINGAQGAVLDYGLHHNVNVDRRDDNLAPRAVHTPSPVQYGQVQGCTGWRYVSASDTCAKIVSRFKCYGLTQAKLIQWNPALKSDCSGLARKHYVCVKRDSPPQNAKSMDNPPAAQYPPGYPSPIQAGQAGNCVAWRYVSSSDTCSKIVNRFQYGPTKLTMADLLKWNPALGSNCSGLKRKHYLCVQTGTPPTSSRTTTAPALQRPTSSVQGLGGDISTTHSTLSTSATRSTTSPTTSGLETTTSATSTISGSEATASTTATNDASTSDSTSQTSGSASTTDSTLTSSSNTSETDPESTTTGTDTTTDTTSTITSSTLTTDSTSSSETLALETSSTTSQSTSGASTTDYTSATDSSTSTGDSTSSTLTTDSSSTTDSTSTESTSTTDSTSTASSSTLTTISTSTSTTISTTTTTSASTTATTTATTTTNGPPGPTQEGQVANCVQWHPVEDGDTCDTIVTENADSPVFLTRVTLLQWNPALGDDCSGLQAGYSICIRAQHWLDAIAHQGRAPYAPTDYKVYRNVKDFGAKGDGITDDTVAIQDAIASGNRCGLSCDSSTTKPALIYFPPGTYKVSATIQMYYFTHFVGDPVTLPRLKASSTFPAASVIDANPYDNTGHNWHGSTNNFYKVIRNLIIDTTDVPAAVEVKGIHWQVAQATSLDHVKFFANNEPGTQHWGLYMEDGSGGYLSDLEFNGGLYGANLGNQQFTLQNMVFNDCGTGLHFFWGWLWDLKGLIFNNVGTAIDISAGGPDALGVGSVVVADSTFINVGVAVKSEKSATSSPKTANSLVLDNIRITNCPIIVGRSGDIKLAGSSGSMTIDMWAQGRSYDALHTSGQDIQGPFAGFVRPSVLLDGAGNILGRSKPQYADLKPDQILSARAEGCQGNGIADDTVALQAAINKAASENKVLYIDYGVYVVSTTIRVPPNARIMGEVWPVILGFGPIFTNVDSPVPIVQFGQPGETGFIECTNFIVATRGPMKGAILMEWNLASTSEISGLYDVHARVGGFQGSNLDANTCIKTPDSTTIKDECIAAFMLMWIRASASGVYLGNVWLWTADHDLDLPAHSQISVYVGRGLLVESTGPVWLYGTASEHNVLYQYQFSGAQNVYMGAIQTESPYFQANPDATRPFDVNPAFDDPDYDVLCPAGSPATCKKSLGLIIKDSSNILCYGSATYSWFENYTQQCVDPDTCQQLMTYIENSSNIRIYNINTKGTETLFTVDNNWSAAEGDNENAFVSTVALLQI
ncbi:hypothetical protein TWF696_003860 [Orbilia brochopaga]|uniref:LysM domain-containing protein n=1 Tax=Orbilia brochopaga TaxID=3140254 RepID=A0AAV9VAW3_9PEZI